MDEDCTTLTVTEAARRLGIGRNSAYQAASRGEIPAVRVGRRVLVPVIALEQWLSRRQQGDANHGL